MTVLVTGAAGFIGFHTSQALLARGERVVGIDNFNDYYDVELKENRAARLLAQEGFSLVRADISDREAMAQTFARHDDIDRIIHLAAQAGVRYSLINPYAYTQSNVDGHLVLMEAARGLKNLKHFAYASSSSVYGANTKLPFAIEDPVDHPVSLYAATKRSMELLSESYARMYGLPLTGLRFFTVYGPWGRPDMAPHLFTSALFEDRPIRVFNHGRMRRDFTYVADLVRGIRRLMDCPPGRGDDPVCEGDSLSPVAPWRVVNIGNGQPVELMDFIAALEDAAGRKARLDMQPMQQGDVPATWADAELLRALTGDAPRTDIAEGTARYVEWYRDYYGVDRN